MINQNRVLRTSDDVTVNSRNYDQVLADATDAAITVTLISPAGFGEYRVKVQNVGDGSFAVTVAAAGGKTINGTTALAAAGSAAIYEIDELGNFHVFADSSGGTTGDIDGGGTAGTVAMFTAPTTVGDSLFNQSSGVGSIGADFGVDSATGEIASYSGSQPTDGQLIIGDTGSTMKVGSLASADASVVITPSAGGIDLSAANAGIPAEAATNTLFLLADVASTETVTIGADVYEIEIVNTDSTDDTQGGDFVPLTNPLVVVDAVTNYPNVFALVVGDLIRIGTEILRITVKGAADMTFARGASGTTIATHADAADIFIGNGIAGGSTIAVGLVTTLTPAAFNPALIDDINTEGTEPFTASADDDNVKINADATGDGGNGTVCSETLAGAGNQWQSLESYGGLDAGQAPSVYRALLLENATDPPAASILQNTLGVLVWSYSAAGVYIGTLTGAFAGLVSLAAGDGIPSGAGQYTVVTLTRIDNDSLSLKTYDVTMASGVAVLADDLLAGTYVEIQVWP